MQADVMHVNVMQGAYQAQDGVPVQVIDSADIPWQHTPDKGLRLKPVRYDNEQGHFLGLLAFDTFARSGLHQHRGVATSFIVQGGLTDHHGSVGLHEVGINLAGATHDAVAHQPSLLVSRLEGPVVYPHSRRDLTGLHAGSAHAEFVNPAPEVPPEVNVAVDSLPRHQTGMAGWLRQTVFDYAGTGSPHRLVQWVCSPGAMCKTWRANARVDMWVRGGALAVNGQTAHANCFVVVQAGALLQLSAPFGALVLVWAEGPEEWAEDAAPTSAYAQTASLFGY
jgi:hypothetical protein